MKAAELYVHLQQAIGAELKSSEINKGMAFFWREKIAGPKSTRVLRICENAAGTINEIKLPVTSLLTKSIALLPLPVTLDAVAAAVRREIDLLEGKERSGG